MELGYKKRLFLLTFDHRGTVIKTLFNKELEDLTNEEREKMKYLKGIIYKAFQKTISDIPKDEAYLLVDEQFGEDILIDAKEKGYNFAVPVEKSGEKEFEFEYNDFEAHIDKFNPTFVKVLIRYNPAEDEDSKIRQREKLKLVNDYCKKKKYKFMLELLLPPKEEHLKALGKEEDFEQHALAMLTEKAIVEFQEASIEPDVWKLEGMSNKQDYEKAVAAVKREGRDNVGIVILGRGEKREKVEKWLYNSQGVNGIIGFAIGRSIFIDPIIDFLKGEITEREAIHLISLNYLYFYQFFNNLE